MRFPFRLPVVALLAALVSLAGAQETRPAPPPSPDAQATEQVAERAPLPPGWRAADAQFTARRFTVEVARFPSTALAEAVRAGLVNMGWKPVHVEPDGDQVRVTMGYFSSIGAATALAEELRAMRTADARVVHRPRGEEPARIAIEGPRLDPFVALSTGGKEIIGRDEAMQRLRTWLASLGEEEAAPLREKVELLAATGNDELKGAAAIEVLRRLQADRELPDTALYLALRVARRDWQVDTPSRLFAGELAADLLYGHKRDWLGAWRATEALLDHSDRRPAGRARDHLRRAALLVDLAAGPDDPKPSWPEVRAALRQAWDAAPPDAERTRAKIELVYVQTFAWEGKWARVEELADAMRTRYAEDWSETGLASVYYARSLERRREFDRAIGVLDRVTATRYDDSGLTMGFERLDLASRASQHRRALMERSIAEQP